MGKRAGDFVYGGFGVDGNLNAYVRDVQEVIGAFDRRTIIELSSDVIKEIAKKYENVQKGVGDIMGGALIETEARRILNKGISEAKRETALRMLKRGKMAIEEIAEDTGLSVAEVKQLADNF